jgi:TetR/AcrR family transcriptional regulator, cholesterol catabolism regulator
MMDHQAYDQKLARILRVAAGEIAQRGFHNTGIRDISRATGVSIAGLYHYFSSKEELLFLIQHHCFGTVLGNLERLLLQEQDPRVRLRLLIANHLRFFVANMEEMKVLSHEAASLTGEYRSQVNAQKRRYTELCLQIMEQLQPQVSGADRPDAVTGRDGVSGQEAGGGRTHTSPRTATFALFGMMNWVYNWYDPARDAAADDLAEQMTRLFLQGFSPGMAEGPMETDGGDATPSIWRGG